MSAKLRKNFTADLGNFRFNVDGLITHEDPILKKEVDVTKIFDLSNPYFSHITFDQKIAEIDKISDEELYKLLEVDLNYILNKINTDPKYNHVIYNVKMIRGLIKVLKDFREGKKELKTLNHIIVNKILYTYISSEGEKDSSIIDDVIQTSLDINTGANIFNNTEFDKKTIALLLLAKNSESNPAMSILNFNNVLMKCSPEVCTTSVISTLYGGLYHIGDIFTPIMFDVRQMFESKNAEEVYKNISVALIDTLAIQIPSTIYTTLWGYAINCNANYYNPTRFSLINTSLPVNIQSMIQALNTMGIYLR